MSPTIHKVLYLVESVTNFSGSITSSVSRTEAGTFVDFSGSLHNNNEGNLTLEEYRDRVNPSIKLVSEKGVGKLLTKYNNSLVTEPKEITEDEFFDALECMPPSKWGRVNGVELFHICERITGDMVSWFAKVNGQCFSFVDHAGIDKEFLAYKVGKLI